MRFLPASLLLLAAHCASSAAGLAHFGTSPSPAAAAARQMLFEDQQGALFRRAAKEEELLRPNMREMTAPTEKEKRQKRKKRQNARSAGVGFGGGAAAPKSRLPKLSASEKEAAWLRESVAEDGVVLIPNVLSRDVASELRKCVLDEIERSREAVRIDPSVSVSHFNAPVETHDPLRGYVLLPFVDSESAAAGRTDGGPMVRAMRDILGEGTVLGDLFGQVCDGANSVFYDWTVLRTEAGANRQPIHADTPYQKTPALFCAFVALQDVTMEMGGTLFLPKTHTQTEERLRFDRGANDGTREQMLSAAQPRYALLKAGDAALFDMRILHAGLPNMAEEFGGKQRIILAVTFRNPGATEELGHKSNMRSGYVGKYTLGDVRRELVCGAPFARAGDGLPPGRK